MRSSTSLEPGVFGIFTPILLLPDGLTDRLSPAQMQCVLAHEFCHVRRYDNLTSAFHMVVEAVFWFHPLVWWIKARLLEEQERACDEGVLGLGNDPQVYAESILEICEFYVTSPLSCVSGITGSNLKKRIGEIMNNRAKQNLTFSKTLLLAAAALAAIGGPIAIGVVHASAPTMPVETAIGPLPVPRSEVGIASTQRVRPEFEVADVHVSPPRPDGRRVGQMDGVTGNWRAPWTDAAVGGRYEVRNATMMELIATAYDIETDAVFGGPDWMTSDRDRFDVIAKPPEGKPSRASIKSMLQSLLADRFDLVVRNDTRPLSAWVLSKGAGPLKMKTASGSEESACRIVDDNERVACRHVTIDAFVAAIREGMLTTLPVVNATGIEGSWDFDLKYTVTRGYFGVTTDNPIISVVDKQLGLKLELQKIPQRVLIVERVNRAPTANVADLEKRLPPPPVEFEVASIRPCEFVNPLSARGETGARFSASGLVTTGCLSLQRHIAMAWDRPGRLEGAPGWLNSRYFNIVAKSSIPVLDANDKKYQAMMRNLLIDRFKLAYHFEERAVDAYELVAEKPKLKKPDPSGRTGCKLNDGAGFVVGIPNTVACQNVTLAQFAEELGNVGDVYTRPGARRPVADATGIEGTWDLTVTYWQVPGPRANVDGAERTGSPTIFEALDKQLGLKLKETRRPRPFLVIDHIEENPTEN
jgi:uncharacterized protein (TIGR03435 family)